MGRFVSQFLSALALVGGIFLLVVSISSPFNYQLGNASAVQVSQVYNQAMMYGIQACGLLLLAGVLQLTVHISRSNEL